MRHRIVLVLLFLASVPGGVTAAMWSDRAAAAQAPAPRTYYLSSSDGNDAWDGTSSDRAWRSLARASQARFAPGDRLLLKAGDRFAGQLVVGSSGAPGRPLRISSYGSGPRPLVAGSSWSAAILIRNQQQIEISELEITNRVDRAAPGEPRDRAYGILIENTGGGVLSHFRIERTTIRDVYAQQLAHASEDDFNKVSISAIRLSAAAGAADRQAFFQDVVIADNAISRSGRFGVQIVHDSGGAGNRDAHSRDPETGFNRDIVIRSNRFLDLGGSAVQLGGARNALIENNDFERTGSSAEPERMVGRGSGAWVINSRDIVAQHNRSRSVRGYKDSYGMHVDFGNLNVLYQYNFSEDSEGGFVEILGNNRNVIWRYNISVNDGLREKDGNTIWLSPWSPGMVGSAGIYIYNNTVFVRAGLYPDIDLRARDAHVWNNIFYAANHAMIGERSRIELTGSGLDLAGNLYFGRFHRPLMARDTQPLTADPAFARPGVATPESYRLRPGSPALRAGIGIRHPPFPAAGKGVFAGISALPEVDFFGTALGTTPHAGAALSLDR
jgi:hypothetical protein